MSPEDSSAFDPLPGECPQCTLARSNLAAVVRYLRAGGNLRDAEVALARLTQATEDRGGCLHVILTMAHGQLFGSPPPPSPRHIRRHRRKLASL